MIALGELYCDMPAECGGTLADVDCHVKHSSPHASYEFCLRERGALEMQAAHHAASRGALIVLHEIHLASDRLFELPLVVAFEKITARVIEYFGLQYEHAVKFCFYNFHLIYI